jgi:hypothetical protein
MKKRFRSPQGYIKANGRVREDHAPQTVIRLSCSSELCQDEIREFQIVSIDVSKRISVFRCVICSNRAEVPESINSAKVENIKTGA